MQNPSPQKNHTLSPLQQSILNIYKEVKEALDKNGLRYFAIGGTCIGAVRHQGFIPWDDDMDLVMPDSDYKKFVSIAKDILPPHLEMLVRSDHPHDPTVAGRVFDKNNTFIEDHEKKYPEEYKGVFVDILPMGGLPEDEADRARYFKKMKRYMRLNEKRRCSFTYLKRAKTRALWIAATPYRVLPNRYWSDKIYKMQSQYPFDKSSLTGYTWSLHVGKRYYPKSVFDEYIEMPFEDTTVRCPKGYDEMLKSIYGDYMTIPPEDQQKGLHEETSFIDLDKPYSYYQKLYAQTGTLKKETV